MRVKYKTGTSFGRTVAYVLGATKNQNSTVLIAKGVDFELRDREAVNDGKLSRKQIRELAKHIGRSFDIQASCRPLQKPVRHYIMTFPPDDAPKLQDNEFLKEIVSYYMNNAKIKDTQYLVVRHSSTANPHVHIVFNPINDNAEVIS